MKLRNKKTREIIDFNSITDTCFGSKIQLQATDIHDKPIYIYNSLAKLNDEWEDVPDESKDYYYIYANQVLKGECDGIIDNRFKEIGNYFETREQAEKVVEKLKAWKRLKDNGISFETKVIDGRWYLEPKVESQPRTSDEVHNLFKDIMFIFGDKDESNQ